LGSPWRVNVPGGFEANIDSITLDDKGQAAVSLNYSDGSRVGVYKNPGCCSHVAVASWQLGAAPPVAQALEVPGTHQYNEGELGAPAVAIGPSSVTAVWTAGAPMLEEVCRPCDQQLDEAFGPFGGTLTAKQVIDASRGIQSVHLTLDRTGKPVAAWRDNSDDLDTARGDYAGELARAAPPTRIPGYEEGDFLEDTEFTSDLNGHVVFGYVRQQGRRDSVVVMTSVDGSRFGSPRTIARVHPEPGALTVVAGGQGSLLAFWSCGPYSERSSLTGRRGRIFGALEAPFSVQFEPHDSEPQGFIDSRGRAVLVYDREVGHEDLSVLEAITAEPERPFGLPQRISRSLKECKLEQAASSPSGTAIFACEQHAEQAYLLRYTP
jgi:hypothetical protein